MFSTTVVSTTTTLINSTTNDVYARAAKRITYNTENMSLSSRGLERNEAINAPDAIKKRR